MFDRLLKAYLTVETGEAYQPIRLTYTVSDKDKLNVALDGLQCIQRNTLPNSWTWYWRDECVDIHFESITAFKKNPNHDIRLGTLILRDDKFYINLPCFKRACTAVTFFHKLIDPNIARIHTADFINKIFAIDERLPHGFSELLKEEDLNRLLNQRLDEYEQVKEKCEKASTAEDAFAILSEYTKTEAQKRLPYAERYLFNTEEIHDPEIVFLSFYIFLRGRELVAIKRWLGETGYTLADAAEETVEQVFGSMGIDIIE